MKVPFIDLRAQFESISEEVIGGIQGVLESCSFAGGPFVARFEEEFASFCSTDFAVGVGSGTEALWAALLCLGIGGGDEVITVPNTFVATAEAIRFCGAKPVFVDIDQETYTIDPQRVQDVITPRTRAVVPVHLFGQAADMDPIIMIAQEHGLAVVEDACQAHGAEYKGRRVGSIGDAGCFSFYPGKNLGAYGEAGAVVTNNPELATKLRMFRDHGQSDKHCHSIAGWNARMDGLQGALLSVKLRHLPQWNEARRKNASLYNDLLCDTGEVVTPTEAAYSRHVYHVYAISTKDQTAVIHALAQKNISCGIHYPVPIHLQKAFCSLGYGKGNFPVAEQCAKELVSLPMFPELNVDQIKSVVDAIESFYQSSRPK
jgi:dTDP-4-amino-4,6-dideoxygalactose transaminase